LLLRAGKVTGIGGCQVLVAGAEQALGWELITASPGTGETGEPAAAIPPAWPASPIKASPGPGDGFIRRG